MKNFAQRGFDSDAGTSAASAASDSKRIIIWKSPETSVILPSDWYRSKEYCDYCISPLFPQENTWAGE